MTPTEIAWLAGLLEGEGSFGNYSKKTMVDLRVQLAMGDLDVVEKAAAVVGGAPIYTYDRKGQKGFRDHHKPQHKITLRGYQAARVMQAILPYMGRRRSEKIEELLVAWYTRKARTRERGLPPTCHPDRSHYSQGLCVACYSKRQREMRMTALDPSIIQGWHP